MKALFVALVLGVLTVGATLQAEDASMPSSGEVKPEAQVEEVKKEEKKQVRKARKASKKKAKKLQDSTTTQPSEAVPAPDAPAGEATSN